MSEWDFLWGLEGQALEDAMSSGATSEEWARIVGNENIDISKEFAKEKWEKLKLLRDCNLISNEKFQNIKKAIFLRETDNTDNGFLDLDDIEFINLRRLKAQLDKGELTQDEFNRKVKIFVHIE